MTRDLSKLVLDSDQNYMKRSSFVGSTDLTLPAASTAVSYDIVHNLGYIPFITVGAETTDTSTLWSGGYVERLTHTSASGAINHEVELHYWSTTTTLTIELLNGDGTGDDAGQIRTIYWIIYLDYGDV